MTADSSERPPERSGEAAHTSGQQESRTSRQPASGWAFGPIVLSINPDLRARHPDMPLSLDERSALGRHPQRSTQQEPDRELEAEP